jgi:hypothetical protein
VLNGIPSGQGSRTANPAAHQRREKGWIVAIIVAASVLTAATGLLLLTLAVPHTEPSDFAPVGMGRAAAGSIGCRSTPHEICYAAIFDTSLQGLTLAHLRFVVANASIGGTPNGPVAPPLPLGMSAQVTALASPSSVAGVWNISEGLWTSGGDWSVPNGPDVTVVSDTGLVSNATLMDAVLDIVLTSPYEGALGFPLDCGGC